ncbi:methyltransferase domain-containing protein [Cyanobium sp. WKJ7-Wakatipu]|uniref:class I SAM-dependent methyltransferase n=1 Tax=Cyanobium sp. WKJ7-Wakatipu TaxID=2823726 RepID=UPI0020CEC6C1|nr:class I SAM-dependent methyltransferase [Cyanobium sp. WKJ7-Wakatipu]MCP9782354.1 methyltransferase domain-containing protein [Cyanobium sp. WKJ7-Wakatipu]
MQNKLFSSRAEALAAPSGSLDLCQDETGLVFNRVFNPTVVTYDDSYQNDQGHSLQFQRHLDEVCELCRRFLASRESLVVDVGCGKGGFVELLRGKGVNAIGYDNAYQGRSPYVRKSFFSVESHGQGDLLTLRHVLEHIPSPWHFLDGIAAANANQGLLYIEVPDLEWILEHRAYFDLFHEHVNYFRMSDFLRRFGDGVIFQSKSFGGQYLSVVINLECVHKCNQSVLGRDSDSGLQTAFEQLSEYEEKIYTALRESHEIVLWGAAAKGVVFAAKTPLGIKRKITYAIDINPSKQGHFMPISGVEVLDQDIGVARLDPSSLVVIMNPNYEQEIRECLPYNQTCLVLYQ